jgi:hypothetical protein
MRPGLVVEADERGEEAMEVVDIEEEDVVEQLASKGGNEAFGEGVHVWRADGGADNSSTAALESGGESGAELRIAVSDEHFGQLVEGGIAGLLGAPVVGGRRRGRDVNDAAAPGSRKKSTKTGRKSASNAWRKSQLQVTWFAMKVLQFWPLPGARLGGGGR